MHYLKDAHNCFFFFFFLIKLDFEIKNLFMIFKFESLNLFFYKKDVQKSSNLSTTFYFENSCLNGMIY